MKDELLTASELAKRLNVSPQYIGKQKKQKRLVGCIYKKKYYWIKTCEALGRDPSNPYQTTQSITQKRVHEKEAIDDSSTQDNLDTVLGMTFENETEARELLEQILTAVKNPKTTKDRALLEGLKLKATIIKEYFSSKNEELKHRQLEDNLYTREEVMRVLSSATNMFRSSLLNLPNNYAVALDGLAQKEIKEFVAEDINRILEDFYNTGEQFK